MWVWGGANEIKCGKGQNNLPKRRDRRGKPKQWRSKGSDASEISATAAIGRKRTRGQRGQKTTPGTKRE